jgi:hypothetical protein
MAQEGNRKSLPLIWKILLAIGFVISLQLLVIYYRVHFDLHSLPKKIIHGPGGASFSSSSFSSPSSSFPHSSHNLSAGDLPAFSDDNSELIMNSIIERSFSSSDFYITTLFISAAMFDPNEVRQYKVERIERARVGTWNTFLKNQKSILYLSNGRRSPVVKYSCHIFMEGAEKQTVVGHFLPNRQTSDSNSNRRFDIFRCPISNSKDLFDRFRDGGSQNLSVEIYREGTKLIRFNIPWVSRQTGYLSSIPRFASHFDPWSGYESHNSHSENNFHICAARSHHRDTYHDMIYRYTEFIQHHLLIGTTHIFLSVPYSWDSASMKLLVRTLHPFIESSQVTVISESGDNINMWTSTLGLQWSQLTVRNLQIHSCLYLSKGMVRYVGVWDTNEYFIPRLPHHTIQDVINSVSLPSNHTPLPEDLRTSTVANWKGGVGFADGDGHPYCYLSLTGYAASVPGRNFATQNHWIEGLYSSSILKPEPLVKSILPTEIIHQGGLHVAGGCKLDPRWTTCHAKKSPAGSKSDEFCYNDIPDYLYLSDQINTKSKVHSIPSQHNMDDFVMSRDTKLLNPLTDGCLISFLGASLAHKTQIKSSNPYVADYSRKVLTSLRKLGIGNSLDQLPDETITNLFSPDGNSSWQKYETKFPPKLQSESEKVSRSSVQEYPASYDPDDIFRGSSNGFYNFKEDFAQPDLLFHRNLKTLPSFAADYSDIALGAIIERQHNSWNLYVTTFFLQHEMLWKPPINYGFNRIHPSAKEKWEAASKVFNATRYLPSGARDIGSSRYRCRLRVDASAQSYFMPGTFLPNALSPDRNANRRLDIMRCQIQDSMKLYHSSLPLSNESLHVEILRDDVLLFQYSIPWKTRRVGYSLSSPAFADSFNAWGGFDRKDPDSKPGSVNSHRLHMCVAGVESPLSQHTTTQYLEFIQHHLVMGVDHLFLAAAYAWNGKNMANFLVILRSFFRDHLVTVSSLATDNIDLLYSVLGATLDRDNSKVFNVNMCLFLSKGVADYVAVWDTDEFFIPRPPHHSIRDVIRGAESLMELIPDRRGNHSDGVTAGSRGWADGNLHPLCYLQLTSEVVLRNENSSTIPSGHWIGETFLSPPSNSIGLGFKKSIFPTRTIFQAGLHVGGACHLGRLWSGCDHDRFCYQQGEGHEFSRIRKEFGIMPHRFDETVLDKDAKRIDPKKEAVIYHIQIHRPELTNPADEYDPEQSTDKRNAYVTQHFDRVYQELSRRGLHSIESISDHEVSSQTEADTTWLKLYEMTRKYVDSPGSNNIDKLPDPPDSFYGAPDTLPHFVKDCTDVILGAVIERAHDSWDLHATTFFLANEQMANYTGKIINPSLRKEGLKPWMKAIQHSRGIRNTEFGVRNDGFQYFCEMANSGGGNAKDGKKYRVPGLFVANELTPDVNANKRLDILRCKISDSKLAYLHLAGTDESLSVEIFRGNTSLVRYSIPWKTRRVGFMLSSPSNSTRLDPWKGFQRQNQSDETLHETLPGAVGGDMIHMCVPGFESPISKTTLAMYSEFLEHHFTIGVEHIHVGATYTWDGEHMNLFQTALRSYIEDGMISLTSTAADLDLVYGLFGMAMHRDNVKIFFVNMCLYFTKGLAEYLAIWDIDEYFIPKPPHSTISQVISSMDISPRESLTPIPPSANIFELAKNWSGGRGWADAEGHPLCYFMMSSEVLYRPPLSYPISTLSNRWIGTRFLYAPETQKTHLKFKKPIIPTRKIFQGALHMVGGCKLNHPFHGCDADSEFCYSSAPRHRYGWTVEFNDRGAPVRRVDFSTEQRFDGLIMDKDAKKVNAEAEAVIYHIQVHRSYFTSSAPSNSTNEYVTRFFPTVLKNLQTRGIEFLTTIPEHYRKPDREIDASWISFHEMYRNLSKGSMT